MQISDKTNGLNGFTTGALAGGAIGTAAVLKPIAKDSFNKSISEQQEVIEKFKESGTTVSKYMQNEKRKLDIMDDINSVYKTYADKIGKKNESELIKFKEFYADGVKKGTKTVRKEFDDMEKLLNKGKPSKFTAAKDSVKNTTGKVKDKFGSLKNSLKENLNGAEGLKGKFKAAKDSVVKFVRETPSLKKAGKFTLAGAVIGLSAAVIGKAVSKKASAINKP